MNTALESRAKEVLEAALEQDPQERLAYIEQRCAADAELRERSQALLRACEKQDDFLRDSSRAGARASERDGSEEDIGTSIGPYRLIERLGEGGFGAVYMAEQQQPVQRRVALKILKLGLDTRAVVARFEYERQVLALMEHVNIARVFDAGITRLGRPYFAMELVQGSPITQFCDARKLSVRERLGLFQQVCRAVQHAHTKGILHRDIKPANVLVTLQDGAPVCKVIDFGIARAIDRSAAPGTLLTGRKQLVGTPAYMSPEQADASRDIDTRTDVYSLGALLYELLAGVPPFDPKQLRAASQSEVQRMLREVEPNTPSARVDALGAVDSTIATQRATTPVRLASALRGELDWIVMRALEKERERRYGSPEALFADVARFLAGEAVEAVPTSSWYRLHKSVRRHKTAVIASGLVVAALALGTIGTGLGLVDAAEARKRAEAQADIAQDNANRASHQAANARRQAQIAAATVTLLTRDLLTGADSGREGGRKDITVREMLDRAAERLGTGESLRGTAPEARATVAIAVHSALARIYRELGALDAAQKQAEAALSLARAARPIESLQLAEAAFEVGEVWRVRDEFEIARELLNESLQLRLAALGPLSPVYAESANALAAVYKAIGDSEAAEELMQRVLEAHIVAQGECTPEVAMVLGNLAQVVARLGRRDEAVQMLERAAAIDLDAFGSEDMRYVRDMFNLATTQFSAGRAAAAEGTLRTCLQKLLKLYPPDHPMTAACRRNIGYALLDLGRAEESIPFYRAALEVDRAAAGDTNAKIMNTLSGLGRALLATQAYGEAAEVLAELEVIYAEAPAGTFSRWRSCECAALRAEAELGLWREQMAQGRFPTRAEFVVAEQTVLAGYESLREAKIGRMRFSPALESRRCVAAARVVDLYRSWSEFARADAACGDVEALEHEERKWTSTRDELRAADKDAEVY